MDAEPQTKPSLFKRVFNWLSLLDASIEQTEVDQLTRRVRILEQQIADLKRQ